MSIVTDLPESERLVAGGVDTHAEVNVVAAIDPVGRQLGHASFATTAKANLELLDWLNSHDNVTVLGIEGTGSYGASLSQAATSTDSTVVEVDQPDRKTRRFAGKSDPIDAYAAARSTLSRVACGTPKSRNGNFEMIRVLRVARSSAIKARIAAKTQIKAIIKSSPVELRDNPRGLDRAGLINRCVGFRPEQGHTPSASRQTKRAPRHGRLSHPTTATKQTLRTLGQRVRALDEEINQLDDDLTVLVAETAPKLVAAYGVDTDVAGQILATVGDNPDRLHSSAAFAYLCGVAPIPASSGKTNRHRLNRGGDRQANAALYRIAMVRLRYDTRTQTYKNRLATQQKTNKKPTKKSSAASTRHRQRNLPNHQKRLQHPSQTLLTSIGASIRKT